MLYLLSLASALVGLLLPASLSNIVHLVFMFRTSTFSNIWKCIYVLRMHHYAVVITSVIAHISSLSRWVLFHCYTLSQANSDSTMLLVQCYIFNSPEQVVRLLLCTPPLLRFMTHSPFWYPGFHFILTNPVKNLVINVAIELIRVSLKPILSSPPSIALM